ncbi:MAG TPA: HAMP domain-containing sensor histidine kinase, partial [Bacteroidales bacterium]|nr:HAMP domain-containing sensor histidine kinase [Bacteroidales bacterium]
MTKNRIKIVVLLGGFSLIGIIIFQVFWIYNTFNTSEKQFNQTIRIALYNVAAEMADFNNTQLPNVNPVNQISSNYFVVDLNDVIDPPILEHFLKTEFEHSNINIDYEYSIYDCENDAMVYGKYVNNSGKNTSRKQISEFQKFVDYNYYFAIRFPTKTAAILYNMNVWIISGFILITAILFFAYAISVILKQKRLSDIQKDFINNMTHELKTPISTIGISAKVISDPNISTQPERLTKYASIISEQNKRLENQVEKVLQSTLSEKGRISLEIEKLNVKDILSHIISSFELKAREKNGEITLVTNDSLINIYADKSHFENLIFNLLDNAIKYCSTNPKVIVSATLKDKKINLSIEDNGIGIPPSYQNKIFSKFFRVLKPEGSLYIIAYHETLS